MALWPSRAPITVITDGYHMDPLGPVALGGGSHYCDYKGCHIDPFVTSGGPITVITEGYHMDPRGPVAFRGSHYCDYRGVSHRPSCNFEPKEKV